MNLLAIDTSTEYASVALLNRDNVLEVVQSSLKKHAQVLLPSIAELMAQSGLAIGQLDGIVFGRGPGSFTGLRIACSIAKGLAYAHDLPLFPVSSLLAIANEALHKNPSLQSNGVLSLIDARMNQLYYAYYPPQGLQEGIDEFVCSPEKIPHNTSSRIVLAGTGFEFYRDQLPEGIVSSIMAEISCFPTASAMLRLAKEGKITAVSAAEATPVYVRNQIVQGEGCG